MLGDAPPLVSCPAGQMPDPKVPGTCMDIVKPCPAGQHVDPVSFLCVADVPLKAGMGPVGWAAIVAVLFAGAAVSVSHMEKPKRARARRRRRRR